MSEILLRFSRQSVSECTTVLFSRERAIAENLPHSLHRIILLGKAEEVVQMEVPEMQHD